MLSVQPPEREEEGLPGNNANEDVLTYRSRNFSTQAQNGEASWRARIAARLQVYEVPDWQSSTTGGRQVPPSITRPFTRHFLRSEISTSLSRFYADGIHKPLPLLIADRIIFIGAYGSGGGGAGAVCGSPPPLLCFQAAVG